MINLIIQEDTIFESWAFLIPKLVDLNNNTGTISEVTVYNIQKSSPACVKKKK